MNYDHTYHVGNFADVIKHVVIIAILSKLQSKNKALFVMDTHAGAGLYDLRDPRALVTKEAEDGVQQLWQQGHLITDLTLLQYYGILKSFNAGNGTLSIYPGSPQILRYLINAQTRLVLCEKNMMVCHQLVANINEHESVYIYAEDGYSSLLRLVPPIERRGLIVIDPPYEQRNEFNAIINTLTISLKKFPQATYVIWYPIKYVQQVQNFLKALLSFNTKNIFVTEISKVSPEHSGQLNGSGIAIINLPYQVQETLEKSLGECTQLMSETVKYKIRNFWLKQPT